MDCATSLPFDEALAVADSALRSRMVTQAELMRAADRLPGRGRDAALEVAWFARDRPANAFESVIRRHLARRARTAARAAGAPARRRPAHPPDLVDTELRLVVEGDSHEFHTSERAIDADCWRYDELVLDDWLVIRVSWVQAMFQQEWVASVLRRAAERQDLKRGADLLRRRGALRRPTTVGRG